MGDMVDLRSYIVNVGTEGVYIQYLPFSLYVISSPVAYSNAQIDSFSLPLSSGRRKISFAIPLMVVGYCVARY